MLAANSSNIPYADPAQAKAAFLAWFRRAMPQAYQHVAVTAPQLLHGLGQATTPATSTSSSGGFLSDLSSWGTQLLNIAQAAIPVIGQQQILSAQLSRAKQGLPPLDVSQLTPPPVPVQIGVSSGLTSAIGGIGAGTLLLGAGVLAFFLWPRSKRRR